MRVVRLPDNPPSGWERFGDDWRSPSGARLVREVTQDGPGGSSWAIYTLHDRRNLPLARGRNPFALMRRLSELAIERLTWFCPCCGADAVKPVAVVGPSLGTACAGCGSLLSPGEETEVV